MLTSAAGLNVIRHLHENSLCELALQYLLQVSRLLIHGQNFCFKGRVYYISQTPFEIYETTDGRNFLVSASNHFLTPPKG